MLNDEEGVHARAAGTAHLSQLSPETPEGPPDWLIHDPAGGSLSKQFKDKVLPFLTPLPLSLCSAPSVSDTTFFLLPPQLNSSSVVKEILQLVTGSFCHSRKWITRQRCDTELRLFVITELYSQCENWYLDQLLVADSKHLLSNPECKHERTLFLWLFLMFIFKF